MKRQKKTTLVIGVFLFIAFCFFTIGSSVSMAEPIELTVTSFNPPHIPPMKLIQEWARVVEERSGGQVKFTFYFAGSLVKMEDTFRAIQTGLADMGPTTILAIFFAFLNKSSRVTLYFSKNSFCFFNSFVFFR